MFRAASQPGSQAASQPGSLEPGIAPVLHWLPLQQLQPLWCFSGYHFSGSGLWQHLVLLWCEKSTACSILLGFAGLAGLLGFAVLAGPGSLRTGCLIDRLLVPACDEKRCFGMSCLWNFLLGVADSSLDSGRSVDAQWTLNGRYNGRSMDA